MDQAPLRRAEGVAPQLLVATVLGAAAWWLVAPTGTWLGVGGEVWLAAALGVPVVHQLVVAFVWRAELFARMLTRRLGSWALPIFGAVFLPLLVARPLDVCTRHGSRRGVSGRLRARRDQRGRGVHLRAAW